MDTALRRAEQNAIGDYLLEDESPAHRDAIAFPARLLQLANKMAGDGEVPAFSELAKMVGRAKEPYNDQL